MGRGKVEINIDHHKLPQLKHPQHQDSMSNEEGDGTMNSPRGSIPNTIGEKLDFTPSDADK